MTKRSNSRSNRGQNTNGGHMTKVDGQAASVAPEGEATTTTDGGAPAENEPQIPAPADTPEPETTEQPEGDQTEGDKPAEEQVVAQLPDPFADLPVTKVEDYEFRDFTSVETAPARKYDGVQKTALAAHLPVKKDWKHRTDMVTIGRVSREFRPGSVWGTCDQIVRSFGRAGVPAYVLATKLREAQIGNKRSHYCTALPPIGWAEGYIDTFISKGYGKVMEKKAPAIGSEEANAAEAKADEVVQEQKAAA